MDSANQFNLSHADKTQPSILYEDEWLLALDKSSGMLVHPSPIDKKETWVATTWIEVNLGWKPYSVHRLDKATSGVLVFAKNAEVAQKLSADFESQQIHKVYHAIVRGFTPEQGTINYPLKVKSPFRDKQLAADLKPAQDAMTHFKRLATIEIDKPVDRYPVARYSLVKVEPETGRKHQIRRHFKHIFHPLVGDTSYGKSTHNRFFAEHYAIHRLLLAAVAINFVHPLTNKRIEIGCPLSAELQQLYRQLGFCEYIV